MNHISTNNTKQARADLLENLMVEVEKVFIGKRFVVELKHPQTVRKLSCVQKT